MVVLATSISTSSRMLPVLPNTTMSCADVTPLLPVLLQVCRSITDWKELQLILLATPGCGCAACHDSRWEQRGLNSSSGPCRHHSRVVMAAGLFLQP